MTSLLWILAGVAAGAMNLPLLTSLKRRWQDYLLWLLLFSSSLTFGSDPEVTGSLGSLGLISVTTALLAAAASAAAAWGWHLAVGKRLASPREARTGSNTSLAEAACSSDCYPSSENLSDEVAATSDAPDRPEKPHRMEVLVPAMAVLGGWLAGFAVQANPAASTQIAAAAKTASGVALSALLLVIGCDLGKQRIWVKLREYGLLATTLPLAVGAATLLGVSLVSVAFPMTLPECLTAGAGFGWYSLAGPAALAQKGAETGAYVFLSNLFREVLAIVVVPLLKGRTAPEVAASLGGATSMDSSMPVISRSFGPEGAAWGLITGTVLSLACPFVLEFFLTL